MSWAIWGLLAMIALAAAVQLFRALDRNGGRRRFGILLFNVGVPLVLLGLVLVGVNTLRNDPDNNTCLKPDVSAAMKRANADRAMFGTKVAAARTDLRKARESARRNPSRQAGIAVRVATGKLKAAQRKLQRWSDVIASIEEDAVTSFKLGREVNTGTRSVNFTTAAAVPGPTLLRVHVTSFAQAGTGRELGRGNIKAWAELDADRQHGTIYFCFVPEARTKAPSGEFNGSLVLASGRVERLEVPVTLTLSYTNTVLVIIVGLLIALVSSWYVYFLRRPELSAGILLGRPAAEEEAQQRADAEWYSRALRWSGGFWHGYWRWVTSATGAITVVAGMVGVVTAFSAQYLASDSWDNTYRDWFAFIGAVATAFVAAGTAGKLAGYDYDKPIKPSDHS
jgi:hypothetical protein